MTEPQADRYLQAMVWRLARERPARLRPGHAGPARPFLERGPGGLGVLPASPDGPRWPGPLPLWIALAAGTLARRSLWSLAADRGADGRDRADAGPRLLLDRPADARPDRAGDRPDRRRSRATPDQSEHGGSEGHRQQERQVTVWRRLICGWVGVGLGRLRVDPACEDDPSRHREADPRRRDDPDHGRGQPVAGEERDAGREIQPDREAQGDRQRHCSAHRSGTGESTTRSARR